MTLDPAGLEAAAKALSRDEGIALWDEWTPAAQSDLLTAAEAAIRAYLTAAGRAAATETIPREDALQALHEMSTVAGLLRVRRDDPAVVALGDRLRLACRALRDVTAPGMNELMDSQPGRAAATPDPPKDAHRPWPIAPDTVMPPRRQPVRWGSRADDPPTEIHNDPQTTKAYLAGLAAGRTEAAASPDERLREALAEIEAALREKALPFTDERLPTYVLGLPDVMNTLRAALAGVSAEATPDEPIPDSEFIEPPVMPNMPDPEPGGDNPAITPPPNPLNPYPFHEPLRVEHHSDEDKHEAWDEGYAAGVIAGQSLPSTGTGWDRGYAAGVAAERDQAWRWTIHVCPKGHKSLEPPLNGVCWKCWPGGRGPAEEHTAIRVAEVRR